jgi:hypothetical protein
VRTWLRRTQRNFGISLEELIIKKGKSEPCQNDGNRDDRKKGKWTEKEKQTGKANEPNNSKTKFE